MFKPEITQYDMAFREFFLSRLNQTKFTAPQLGLIMSLFDASLEDAKLHRKGLKKLPKGCKILSE